MRYARSKTTTPTPLLNPTQLKAWLGVDDTWLRLRLEGDPVFVEKCVIDLANPGSSRRNLRFAAAAVAEHLGIPASATPTNA